MRDGKTLLYQGVFFCGGLLCILLIGVEQAPLDESNVIDRDARSVSHDYLMSCTIQFSNITGDRHIAASGFFIVRQEVCDGNARLFLDVLLDNSMASAVRYFLKKNQFFS